MKQLTRAFIAVFIVSFALLYLTSYLNSSQGYGGDNTITIYNWGDYIDEDLIAQFEEESGLKVIYQTFDSNEAMMTKVAQGGTTYDLAVPSEYAIHKMKEEGLLIPLDHSKLPNLANIDERFLDLPFDPGNEYSIPYFWGTVGIVFNPELTGDRTFSSWNDLWDPELRNQILLLDGAREVIGMYYIWSLSRSLFL